MGKKQKDKKHSPENKKKQFKNIARQDFFIGSGAVVIGEAIYLMNDHKSSSAISVSRTIPESPAKNYAFSMPAT